MRVKNSALLLLLIAIFMISCSPNIAKHRDFGPVFLDSTHIESTLANIPTDKILLHFWASWCQSCVYELETLTKLGEKEGFLVLAIGIDDSFAAMEALKLPKSKHFCIGLDHLGEMRQHFKINSLPTTIMVNRSGEYQEFVDPESGQKVLRVEGMREWK